LPIGFIIEKRAATKLANAASGIIYSVLRKGRSMDSQISYALRYDLQM
jgi:hypothetical protein